MYTQVGFRMFEKSSMWPCGKYRIIIITRLPCTTAIILNISDLHTVTSPFYWQELVVYTLKEASCIGSKKQNWMKDAEGHLLVRKPEKCLTWGCPQRISHVCCVPIQGLDPLQSTILDQIFYKHGWSLFICLLQMQIRNAAFFWQNF